MTYRMNMKLPPDIRHFLVEVSGMAYSDEYLLRVAAEIARNLLSRTDPDPAAVMAALRGIRKAAMPYHDARVRNLSKLALTLMRRIKKEGFLENPILDPRWIEPGEQLPDPRMKFPDDSRVAIARGPYFGERGYVKNMISSGPYIYEVYLDRIGKTIHAGSADMVFLYYKNYRIESAYHDEARSYLSMKITPLVAQSDPIARKYGGNVVAVALLYPYASDGVTTAQYLDEIPSIQNGWVEVGARRTFKVRACLDDDEFLTVIDRTISAVTRDVGEFYRDIVSHDVMKLKNELNHVRCWNKEGKVMYYTPVEMFEELGRRIIEDLSGRVSW